MNYTELASFSKDIFMINFKMLTSLKEKLAQGIEIQFQIIILKVSYSEKSSKVYNS